MSRNNVPLRNRFRAALALTGKSVASWSRAKQYHESDVWNNLSGLRHTPAIRADIAALLKVSVKKLDAEIAEIAAKRDAERGAA